MTTGLEKRPDAEGEEKQDRPRLVSVKRTTGTERPRARVCDANSEVQGASSEAAAALIFWFFCIKTKEHTTMGKNTHPFGKKVGTNENKRPK